MMHTMMTDDQARKAIARNVQRLLDKKVFNATWLARKTGEHKSQISWVIHGKNLCQAGLIVRIAAAFKVSCDELFRPEFSTKSKKSSSGS